MKVICPISKNELPECCNTCILAVVQDEQIIGCAVKHIARNIFANTELAQNTTQRILSFNKDMTNGD